MQKYTEKWKNMDLQLLLLTVLLILSGALSVFTTTFFPQKGVSTDFQQQIIFYLIGGLLYFGITNLDKRILADLRVSILLITITIGLLALVLILPTQLGEVNRWFKIGQITIQPSEFAKITLILATASLFERFGYYSKEKKVDIKQRILQLFRQPLALAICLSGLLALVLAIFVQLQPSLGNAVILIAVWGIMVSLLIPSPIAGAILLLLFGIGLNSIHRYLDISTLLNIEDLTLIPFIGIIIGLVIAVLIKRIVKLPILILWSAIFLGLMVGLSTQFVWQEVLTDYQRDRVILYVNPSPDPLGSQWQVNQAKIAIASGQVFGKGLLQGTQTNSGLLPYAYTDFAYAAWAEQFGSFGVMLLIALLLLIILRIQYISRELTSLFDQVLCNGVAGVLLINTVIHIGMNLGLLPVTGVPLPLISYGGSAVIVNLIGIGLVQMVYSQQREEAKTSKLFTKKNSELKIEPKTSRKKARAVSRLGVKFR